MKKGTTKAGGRRPEMNVTLGTETIERYKKLYAAGDYPQIAALVSNPPANKSVVWRNIKAAISNPRHKMPLSIAKATQRFYLNKEKLTAELAE